VSFDIDLSGKGWAVLGPRRSGKSWLTKKILDSTDSHLVYDPMREHDGYHHYRPEDRDSKEELNLVVRRMVIPWRIPLFVVDEANKYIEPKPTRLPTGIQDLVDFCGHWDISAGFVARRPVQFHTDIIELADYCFFFRNQGVNDHKYLEGLKAGLGDAVRDLEKYHFIIYGDGDFITHAPIAEPKNPHHTGRAKDGSNSSTDRERDQSKSL